MKRSGLSVLPALFTLANGACGFAACVKVATFLLEKGQEGVWLVEAAWLIFAAMLFDAFDGTIARLTKSATDLGGELDSLCDAVSFGIAPALLVVMWNSKHLAQPGLATFWAQVTWFFCLLYVMAAILRLARFNVENAPDESHHQTFKGLPTPGAAGVVAGLVLFHYMLKNAAPGSLGAYIGSILGKNGVETLCRLIRNALPPLMVVLAFLMVSSRIRYFHAINRLMRGRRTFDYFTYIVFFVLLAALLRELALALIFCGYTLYGPVAYLVGLVRQARRRRISGNKIEGGEP